MTGVEYLNQIKIIDVLIEQKEMEKDFIGHKVYDISAVNFEMQKVKTSHKDTYSLVDKYLDDELKIDKIIAANTNNRNYMISLIQRLSNSKHIQLLYKRYVEFKSFNVIAAEMGYSLSHIMRLHCYAIRNFESKFAAEFKNMIVNDSK